MSSLSPERQTTASAAPLIIYGSNADVYQHWMERTGQAERDDLRDKFEVQWGKHGEPFVLDWIEYADHYAISERQRWCPHPTIPKIGATIDGYREWDDAVIEVKVLSPFLSAEPDGFYVGFINYYAPQLAVQIACRGCTRGLLGVQQGNSAPVLFEPPIDKTYIQRTLECLLDFQRCVDDREPPVAPPNPPLLPEQWITVDLLNAPKGENWTVAMAPTLDRWSSSKETWSEHELAKADVKLLLPDHVGKVTYRDITIKRARNGAVTIKREAA